jgi:hypothetical protein
MIIECLLLVIDLIKPKVIRLLVKYVITRIGNIYVIYVIYVIYDRAVMAWFELEVEDIPLDE